MKKTSRRTPSPAKPSTASPARSPRHEPSFEDAQGWWNKMLLPVTFLGVPGSPRNPAVLWNAGLIFSAQLRRFHPFWRHWAFPAGHAAEFAGYEPDGIQLEFSFGDTWHLPDRPNNTAGEVHQELMDGRMPIVNTRLKHAGLDWSATMFSRLVNGDTAESGNEPLLTEVRWTATNPTDAPIKAQCACHLHEPHISLGYTIEWQAGAPRRFCPIVWQAPMLLNEVGKARLAILAERGGDVSFQGALTEEQVKRADSKLAEQGVDKDSLIFRVEVPPRESRSVRLLIPFFYLDAGTLLRELATPFDQALFAARRYWEGVYAKAGQLRSPEPIVNDSFDAYLYQAMLATGRRPRTGPWILKTSPNNYEHLWSAHASIGAYSMDLRGQHEWSRRIFDTFLEHQGPIPASALHLFGDKQVDASEGFSAHPGFLGNIEGHMAILWTFYHGWILWGIAQHAHLTGDWAWFNRHLDKLILACEWIVEQRRRTSLRDAKGNKVISYGMMPAANAFDWGFGHVFWSDAHTWRGLDAIVQCLESLRHPKAARYREETEAYRQDLIAAVVRSRDLAPPVPLKGKATIPFVPMCTEMLDYAKMDWTYIACGPLNLAWAGVVPARHELVDQMLAFIEAGRPAKKEIPKAAAIPSRECFTEANLTCDGRTQLWRRRLTYEPGWLAHAFVSRDRDDLPEFFEAMYSQLSNGGQHVNLRSPVESREGVAWCQPGQANLLWLIRDMLVREQENTLLLAGACPRAWLAKGQTIEIRDLPTRFGKVSFLLKAESDKPVIRGIMDFAFRTPPASIRLRLRLPGGALPKKVSVNGKSVPPSGNEWLDLPTDCQTIEAQY
ncbi:MAG: hypothetical protein HY343_06725 [Lentisphaerae bacterium]|nr:hypothetical protein [Lentisphaerota bacterium]